MSANGNGKTPDDSPVALALPPAAPTRARGRPRKVTQRLVCERLAGGELVKVVCADLGIDRATPWRWADADPDGFGRSYRTARELQAHALAEQAVVIADGGDAITALYLWAADLEAGTLALDNHEAARALLSVTMHSIVQRDRLRVDTLKWLTGKIAPRFYGKPAEAMPEDGDDDDKQHTQIIVVRREPSGLLRASEGGATIGTFPARFTEDEAADEAERIARERAAAPLRFTFAIDKPAAPIRFVPALGMAGGPAGRLTQDEKVEHLVRLYCETPEGKARVLEWAGSPVIAYLPVNGREPQSLKQHAAAVVEGFRQKPGGVEALTEALGVPAATDPAPSFADLTPDEQRAELVRLYDNPAGRIQLRELLDVPDDAGGADA